MNIVKPNAVMINDNAMSLYQKIERCGRICYKSEDKINENTARPFLSAMIKNGHTAMLEHATIYMLIPNNIMYDIEKWLTAEKENRHSQNTGAYLRITNAPIKHYVSGSFRAFRNIFSQYTKSKNSDYAIHRLYDALVAVYPEAFEDFKSRIDDMTTTQALTLNKHKEGEIIILTKSQFIEHVKKNEPDLYSADDILRVHVTHSVIFTCDRGISHEFVRHRPASFAQESTRYCNYGSDKFDKGITVVKPLFFDEKSIEYALWIDACTNCERIYLKMLERNVSPQQARSVLPNSLKTEIVITATEQEWQHIMNLRYHGTTGAPHPQMKEVMSIAQPLLFKASEGRVV